MHELCFAQLFKSLFTCGASRRQKFLQVGSYGMYQSKMKPQSVTHFRAKCKHFTKYLVLLHVVPIGSNRLIGMSTLKLILFQTTSAIYLEEAIKAVTVHQLADI